MAKLTLVALLRAMVDQDASDLHVTVGSPPQFRISGKLIKAKTDNMSPDVIRELCYEIISEQQKKMFESNHELDFSFGIAEIYFTSAEAWVRSFVKFRP
jgi:twitching motility protein PilT